MNNYDKNILFYFNSKNLDRNETVADCGLNNFSRVTLILPKLSN